MSSVGNLIQVLNELIRSYGASGFFIAMILQAVVAPIPGEVIMMAGGAIFGTLIAGAIGEIGGCVGATICFFISRKGGRPFVVRIVGRKGLDFADRWFEKYGLWAVFFARLIPLVPVDAVSYGAGLIAISFKSFIIATILGMLPRVFFYAYLGELSAKQIEIMGMEKIYLDVLLVLVLILVIIVASIYLFGKTRTERKDDHE